MTIEKFKEIFETIDADLSNCTDNAFEGLLILKKYNDYLIKGANHDIIYSCDIEDLIDVGITEDDVIKLRTLNWMIEDGDFLACFV